MLHFSEKQHQKFIEYFHIKKEPWEYEKSLLEKTKKYITPLAFIPWILFVGIGNSLSMNACHKDSDIDLFIITEKKRLWLVRFLSTLYFFIIWQRKTKNQHSGKFCLSFFITEEAINFEKIALEDDMYLYFRILYMKPIIDINHTYERFVDENKKWCDFSHFEKILEANKNSIFIKKRRKNKNSKIGNICEKILKKILLPKTEKSFHDLWKPFGVIINDTMLKFHDTDKRKEIRKNLL